MATWEKIEGPNTAPPVLEEEYEPKTAPTSIMFPDGTYKKVEGAIHSLADSDYMNRREPGVDYKSEVEDWDIRGGFSRMDTEKERKMYLDKTFGPNNWRRDRFGQLVIDPPGMAQIGVQADQPRAFDAQAVTRYDLADWRGDAPMIAGATVGGLMGGPFGIPAGMALAGLFGAGAKGWDEVMDATRGENLQGPGETFNMLTNEAGKAMAAEGVARTVIDPLGRWAMAPQRHRMTPARQKVMREAMDIGARPSVSQATGAPLLGRLQRITERIFGAPQERENAIAVLKEAARLKRDLYRGGRTDKATLGMRTTEELIQARKNFGDDASLLYGKVDDLVGGGDVPIIPTSRLKQEAEKLVENLPPTKKGQTAFTPQELMQSITQAGELVDFLTIKQAQAARQRLFRAIHEEGLVPGIYGRDARRLHDAASKMFDDIGTEMPTKPSAAGIVSHEGKPLSTAVHIAPRTLEQAKVLLGEAQNFYKTGIRKFDDTLIAKIVRDAGKEGSVAPEQVVDLLFQKDRYTKLRNIMSLLPETTRAQVRSQAFRDLIQNSLIKSTDDPVEKFVTGKAFMDALDGYGRETLVAMFGKQKAKEMIRLGRIAKLISKKQKDQGGLIAAAIASRPLKNLPRLLKLKVVQKFFHTEKGLKWLTVGLDAPNAREVGRAMARVSALMASLARDETGSRTPLYGGHDPAALLQ